ncbi:MAG: EAL domain-containing protein [Pseudomonadota bacterium]
MQINWYSKQNLKNKLLLILIATIVLVVGILGSYFEYFLRSNYAEKSQQQIHFAFQRISTSLNSLEDNLKQGITFIQDDEIMISSLQLIDSYQDKNNYNAILLDEEKKNITEQLLYRVKLSLNDSIALYDTHQELLAYVYKTSKGYRLNFISYESNRVTIYSRLEQEEEYQPIPTKFLRLIPYRHTSNYTDPGLYSKGIVTYHKENDELIVSCHMSLLDKQTNKLIVHVEMSQIMGKSYFKELSDDLNIWIHSSSDSRFKTLSSPLKYRNQIPILNESNAYKGFSFIVTKDGPLYIISNLDKTFQSESLKKNRTAFVSIILALTLIAIALLRYLFNQQIANPLQKLMEQIQTIKNQNYNSDILIKTGDELELISKSMHQLAKTVHDREHMLTQLLELSPIAVRIAKANGSKVLFANNAYAKLIDTEKSTLIDKSPKNHYANKNEYDEIVTQINNNEVIRDRLVELFINNQTIWVLASYIPMEFEGELSILGWFYDITKTKEHEQQLEHIAHYDSLTGLPNRVLNSDRLRQAMAQALRRHEHIAVLYLDLDGFKEVNDRYGHAVGDQLLVALSARMKQALREGDTLSRLGGDEFIAILTDMNDTSIALPIIQRLLDAASQTIYLEDIVIQVSASIGVTFYPQFDDVDADQLIRQGDQSMYEAKQSGKNRYHIFNPEHDRTIRIRHENLERIQQALSNNEFVLYYQPKINMRTGDLIGAEALIRWQHPQEGLIPPLKFLPIIENHPLAVEIGEWVINEAISQIQRWQNQGLNLPVSVNVGARQLLQGDFVERLLEILAKHENFDSSLLEIEVLETSALEDVTRASQIIEECKKLGIHFALDDFGTGYSSLTYLKRLPVATLKIDQSFVRDMLDDSDDLAILAGIVGLASAFGRAVIAEGVETHEHGKQLLLLGCDYAQGYGIARPMPAEKLIEWSQKWSQNHEWMA